MSFSSFSGSKCKKRRDDNYGDSEKTQMGTNSDTEEDSSVSEKNFLEKRPKEENATEVCFSSYVTTKSCSNVSSTVNQKLDLILNQLSSLDLE